MSSPLLRPPAVRLHQLEGFFHVATHQGYARAVAALPYAITEPALHQQVRKLEAALDVSLLERAPKRRMVLTPAGRTLYRFVAPYFEQLDGVLRSVADGVRGTLALIAEPLYIDPLCAPALAALREDYPEVELRLDELDTTAPSAAVLTGQADLAVAIEGAPTKGVTYEALGELGLLLLVPGEHPLARRRPPLSAKVLRDQRFVVYPRETPARRFTEAALEQAGVELQIAAEASSANAMRSLVRAGVGPAFVPAPMPEARRVQRRVLNDGTVAFDLTRLLQRFADLPRFGVYGRSTSHTSGLVVSCCAALQAQLKKTR